jgi:3-hydroxybutyryl-CoA dehydrogenase
VDDFKKVGVVGDGLMDSGIAEVCARAGLDVLVTEVDAGALDAARARVSRSLDRAVHNGKLSPEDASATADRLSYTTGLGDFADRDLVVEAIAEQEEVKTDVFAPESAMRVGCTQHAARHCVRFRGPGRLRVDAEPG